VPADFLEHLEPERAPADGGNRQDLVRRRREPVEPPPHHLADALRDGGLPPRLGLAQPALRGEQPDDLTDEERVAARLVADPLSELTGRALDTGDQLDEPADTGGIEPPQRDPPRTLGRGQVRERFGKRVVTAELDVAVGADHEQPGVGELAGEEPQQEQRRFVGPVEVVEHEHERAGLRGAREEARNRVEEAKARLLRRERRRALEVTEPLGQFGDDLRHDRRPASELHCSPTGSASAM